MKKRTDTWRDITITLTGAATVAAVGKIGIETIKALSREPKAAKEAAEKAEAEME